MTTALHYNNTYPILISFWMLSEMCVYQNSYVLRYDYYFLLLSNLLLETFIRVILFMLNYSIRSVYPFFGPFMKSGFPFSVSNAP